MFFLDLTSTGRNFQQRIEWRKLVAHNLASSPKSQLSKVGSQAYNTVLNDYTIHTRLGNICSHIFFYNITFQSTVSTIRNRSYSL